MPVKYDEYYSAQDHALGPAYADVIAFFQNLEKGKLCWMWVLDKGGMHSTGPDGTSRYWD